MRIKVMDSVFDINGLGEIVKNYIQDPANKNVPIRDPESNHISVDTVVDAYYKARQEAGLEELFQKCVSQIQTLKDEKRELQLAEGAVRSYKILQTVAENQATGSEHQLRALRVKEALQALRKTSVQCDLLYKKVFPEQVVPAAAVASTALSPVASIGKIVKSYVEVPEATAWLQAQSTTLRDIVKGCEEPEQLEKRLELQTEQLKSFIKTYETVNEITKLDASVRFAEKTLHGAPSDQNRLGKVGEQEITRTDGTKSIEPLFEEGFQDFYIAGSQVVLAHRVYDIMQAPLSAHRTKDGKEKVDTVLDFWNTVVVLRKSPVIITTHDPEEKIPTRGYMERADYWSKERFTTPIALKNGWTLHRASDDTVVKVSRHAEDICIVRREFLAHHAATSNVHRVTQVHYRGWPDHLGTPDFELFEAANQEVEKVYQERALSQPVTGPATVHCAAGMGRSPCMAAYNNLRLQVFEQLKRGVSIDDVRLNIPETIYAIKKQRPSTLGGKDHWRSIHFALRRLYWMQKGLPMQDLYALEHATESVTIADGRLVTKLGNTEFKKLKDKEKQSAPS